MSFRPFFEVARGSIGRAARYAAVQRSHASLESSCAQWEAQRPPTQTPIDHQLRVVCVECERVTVAGGEWRGAPSDSGAEAAISHGICPVCLERTRPDLGWA